MTSNVFGLLFANVLFLAAGAGITAVVGWWRGRRALTRCLGLSYLVGVGAYGVVAQLLFVAGASLATWQVVTVCAVPGCGIIAGLRRTVPPARFPQTRWRLAAGPVVAVIVVIAVDLWFQPLWAYDSWTFWTPKAHALWALNGLNAGWFTAADLTSKDYPLLLPSVEAAGFRFSGYETRLLDIQSLFFFAAFLRAVYEVSVVRAKPAVLWSILAMLAIAPSVTNQLAAAEADIPVAVLFASAGLAAAVWLTERRSGALAVTCVLAAGASATKLEGLEFAIALFVALATTGGSRRRAAQSLAAGVVAVVVGIVPWRIWLSRHGVPNQGSLGRITDFSYLAAHAWRVPLAVGYMLGKILDPRSWLLTMPLFGIVVWRAWRGLDRRLVGFVALSAALSFAGLAIAYWSTRLGLHYQLSTSARRVVTGVVFFCAAATPLLSART